MAQPRKLELNLSLAAGREVECARYLRSQVPDSHWPILAALAAELVAIHETTAAGQTVLVITATEAEQRAILQGRQSLPPQV